MTVLSIKEILEGPASPYKGSELTKAMVEEQIKAKYGETELKNLDCFHSLRTFNAWLKLGFRVKKGEKAIKSYTFVEKKNTAGEVVDKYKKSISLFYYRQIEPLVNQERTCKE